MDEIARDALFSPCRAYRYRLTRFWGRGVILPFVMLNPSVADDIIDDPTIRRCMGFARREGAGGVIVANLFAFRATRPRELAMTPNAVGPDNQEALDALARDAVANAAIIICAWGARAGATGCDAAARFASMGARLACLGKTKDGHPRHPLYARADQPLQAFP